MGGSTYLLQNRSGEYYITESDLAGRPSKYRVEYTLGDRRIQHYLTKLPDGSFIVLSPTWDIGRKRWVHASDVANPEEGRGVQIWNKSCYSCHVSEGRKNFDPQHLSYHTTWQDLGVACEQCHGSGDDHVKAASNPAPVNPRKRALIESSIINPARLDPTRSSMICGACHSYRDLYAEGFKAGDNYFDFFLPVLPSGLPAYNNPPYWPDGRPRRLSNEVLALWQSQCFLQGGATCTTCHSQPHDINVGHNPRLRLAGNTLCTQCHRTIAANVPAHTHHALHSRGSSCIDCHMPAVVEGIGTKVRDHSMSIPVPENTIRHNIPNACNVCHRDKDAQWALRQVNAWYPAGPRQKLILRADAFATAASGDPAAIPGLLKIASDSSQGGFIRANAVGYLGTFPNDPAAYQAVLRAFSDGQPLVRATAATTIRPLGAQRAAVAPMLASLLKDPAATVRASAAIALVAMGVPQLPGEDGERFEQAKALYRARAEIDGDNPQQQAAAGRFFLLARDPDSAVAAFRASLKLDPGIPVRYYLARALAEKGDSQSASAILKAIPANDPQYAAAQDLLASIENQPGQSPSPSGAAANSGAEALFREGQNLYRNQSYGGALQQLDEALRLEPHSAWAAQAQLDRAVCLEKLARTSEAEAAMRELAGTPAAAHDLDFQLAFVELLYDTGQSEEGLKRIDSVIAAFPQSPMVYLWRAKLLLQLHRNDQAAAAAEESVRLLPDSPAAHNLLIRIYQLQGRTKDAAEQAQWLRDYERRLQSH